MHGHTDAITKLHSVPLDNLINFSLFLRHHKRFPMLHSKESMLIHASSLRDSLSLDISGNFVIGSEVAAMVPIGAVIRREQ